MVVRRNQFPSTKRLRWLYLAVGTVLMLGLAGFTFRMAYPTLTYRGVPLPILVQFLRDPYARRAYLNGNAPALHHRLGELGVEEQIKAFYRPQIPDERTLDQYIHQLMYDNTGYVGAAYDLNAQGKLVPKTHLSPEFWRWFKLAKQLNLVTDHETEQGVLYVITTPGGTLVPYETMAQLYSIADLEHWVAVQQGE